MPKDETDETAQIFQSFFVGGFECSTHRRTDGVRLDLLRRTRHDLYAESDYNSLAQHGITTVRDGLRWHLIEQSAGSYDWSSFLPQLRAAQVAGVQPVWDICHYGWPDDIDIWSPDFVDRFALFAGAVAALVRDESDDVPYYCPINEISFWAWAGADTGKINPLARRRGMELKRQLVRATVAAIEAIWAADPRARFVSVDPAIHILPKGPRQRVHAENARLAQYQAFDMVAGKLMPELGGKPEYLDIIGINYYPHNQWIFNGAAIKWGEPLYRPLREILAENWQRYDRPLFIAETGAEAERRVPWLRYVCDEVAAARGSGVPVGGICLYPITDYPGWANNRHCPTGLLGYADWNGRRPVYEPLAEELQFQMARFQSPSVCATPQSLTSCE